MTRSLRPLCRPRKGFTLVEVLVAVAVLTTGLLTGAACVEHAARIARAAARRSALAASVAARAELLRATSCAANAGTTAAGTSVSADVTLRWRSERVGDVAFVSVTARRATGTASDSATLAATRWCGP